MPVAPNLGLGATGLKGCSAVSYFSARKGSIIGAGRLSFRVRDGSGRFPAAITAVTLFSFKPQVFLVVGCGLSDVWMCVVANALWCLHDFSLFGFVCKFSAG